MLPSDISVLAHFTKFAGRDLRPDPKQFNKFANNFFPDIYKVVRDKLSINTLIWLFKHINSKILILKFINL